jgi:hypothetical protein
MPYRILGDVIVVVHLIYVLFAVLGGLLVLRWKRIAWIHAPSALWAVLVEFTGGVCPLTPLENLLRSMGGDPVYRTGFIEHYILPLLYPVMLTRRLQLTLGFFLLIFNLWIYGLAFRGSRKNHR